MASIIEYLKAQNAFTYREFELPLEKQGFVYLRGKNGSGKSTPWEILQHLYYGTTSRGLRLNNIVCPIPRDDPKEETGYVGETVIRNDAGPWTGRWLIRQARGHKKYKTTVKVFKDVDGEWSKTWQDGACPKGIKEAQALAEKIIGLKKNEFEGCLYLSQGMTHALIEGKPAEKSAYLSYLFGIDRLDAVLKILKGRLDKVESQLYDIAGMEGQLTALQSELEQLSPIGVLTADLDLANEAKKNAQDELERLSEAKQTCARAIDAIERREALQGQLDAIDLPKDADLQVVEAKLAVMTRRNGALAGLIRDAERREVVEQKLAALANIEDPGDLDRRYEEAREREIQLAESIRQANKRLELEQELADAGKVEEGDPDDIQVQIDAAIAERQEVKSKIPDGQRRAELLDQIAEAETDQSVEDLEDQVSIIEKGLAIAKARQQDLKTQQLEMKGLVKAVKGGSCPTCKRPMNPDEVKRHLDDITKQLLEVQQEVDLPSKNLIEAKRNLDRAKTCATLRAKLDALPEGNLDELRERSAVLKTKITRLRDWQQALAKAATLLSQIEELQPGDPDELYRLQEDAKTEVTAITTLKSQVRQKADLEKELAGIHKEKLGDLQREQKNLDSAIPNFTEIRDKLKEAAVLKGQLDKIPLVEGQPDLYHDELENLTHDEANTRVKYDEAVSKVALLTDQRDRVSSLLEQVEEIQQKMSEFDTLRHRQLILEQACKAVPKLKRRKLHQIACAIRDVLPSYAGIMFSHEPNTTFQVEEDEEGFDLLVRRMVHVSQGEGAKSVPEYFYVPVKGLSGGEKQRLSVALVFTLHGLLDPGKQPDILILDEVDYGLDDNGVASLMALIEEIKGNYGTVIMTSHRPQISGAVFDRVWEATKTKHVSTIRQIEKAA